MQASGHRPRGHAAQRQPVHRAGRRRRAVAGRVRPPRPQAGRSSDQVKTVVIDSLNGYQAAMPEENSLILHMHELLQYLNRQGAATFLTVAQHGLVGDMKAPVDVTYLADTVILLRYFEALGTVRRAMSIIKKRTGAHEIRQFANFASTAVGSPSASRSTTFRACCAAFRPTSAKASRCWRSQLRETRPIVRARRRSRSDGTRRLGCRGPDPGGGLLCQRLRRPRRADARDRRRRRSCRDRRRGDQDRRSARL